MKYQVTITETLSRTVDVEAHNEREAEEAIRELYRGEDIVLDSGDFVDVEFTVEPADSAEP